VPVGGSLASSAKGAFGLRLVMGRLRNLK